jgi:hypothetical protein
MQVLNMIFVAISYRRAHWPRGLKGGSAAARFLGCGFETRKGHEGLSVVCVVCCTLEVSASV